MICFTFCLSFFVLYKGKTNKYPSKEVYLSFFALGIVLSTWASFFTLSLLSSDTLLWVRLTMLPGVLIPTSFIVFFRKLTSTPKLKRAEVTVLTIVSITFIATIPTPYLIESASLTESGLIFKGGILYSFSGLFLIFGMMYGVYLLVKEYRETKKRQIQYLIIGIIVVAVSGWAFSYGLPAVGLTHLSKYSPLVISIFFLFYAYVITKEELFDIKIEIINVFASILPAILCLVSMSVFYVFLSNLDMYSYTLVMTIIALFWLFVAERTRQVTQSYLENKILNNKE
ncbi:MAG: hypothetical protein HQK84_03120 [Nitrospinae bacterium]|nr:hypothetical protein [Nitrospinota bacterium]